jgi:hypothetical protein
VLRTILGPKMGAIKGGWRNLLRSFITYKKVKLSL